MKDNAATQLAILKRSCFSLALSIAAFIFWPAIVSAQAGADATPQGATTNRTSADESFELNISEKRITERDFEASTTVEAGEETARGLRLRVGVAVSAEEIDVLLRNVQGRVRFRATLDRVLKRLNSRRMPAATVP